MKPTKVSNLLSVLECPVCDSHNVAEGLVVVDGADVGLPGIQLKGISALSCRDCGEITYDLPEHSLLASYVSKELSLSQGKLSPEAFSTLRRLLMLSGRDLSKAAGFTNVSLSRWETSQIRLPTTVALLLRALAILPSGLRKRLLASETHSVAGTPSIDLGNISKPVKGEPTSIHQPWGNFVPSDYVISKRGKSISIRVPGSANDSVYEWFDQGVG